MSSQAGIAPLTGVEDAFGAHELERMHRAMVLLRVFDERCAIYHRQGRIGPAPRAFGHEAVQVGAFCALRDRDWIFPTYRETALPRLRGMPLSIAFAQWRGHPSGWWDPARYRIASACIAVGTQVPHAAGYAWAQRLSGSSDATLVFFGDGATSEGSFHEGVNIAAVFSAPLVLLCNNNAWAISTPLERQTRAARLVDKAIGYGIPGDRVDGHDVIAVRQSVERALARARSGGGPTLIEAVTERIEAHGTADDDSLYRDPASRASAREGECLARFEALLMRHGLLTEARVAELRQAATDEVKRAMRDAESLSGAGAEMVFDTAFVDPPAQLVSQRRGALGGDDG